MPINAFDVALQQHWAMEESALRELLDISARRGRWRLQAETEEDLERLAEAARAERTRDPEAISLRTGKKLEGTERAWLRDGVAVIPVMGPIFHRANLFTKCSGATSAEQVARDLDEAVSNPNVKAILLDVDSPGGQVDGTGELAGLIHAANRKKPVHCYSGGLCASAAYWLASACESISIAPTTRIGSIGVISAFPGKEEGVIEIVSSQSPNKSPDLTTEGGRATVQKTLDELAEVFIGNVASYRGVSRETVVSDYGRGGVLVGRSAVKVGMADRVSSFEAAFRRIAQNPEGRRARALTTTSGATACLPDFFVPTCVECGAPGAGLRYEYVAENCEGQTGELCTSCHETFTRHDATYGDQFRIWVAGRFVRPVQVSEFDSVSAASPAGAPFEERVKNAHAALKACIEDARAIHATRQEEGRTLSQERRADLMEAHTDLGELIRITEKRPAVDVRELQVKATQHRAAALRASVGSNI